MSDSSVSLASPKIGGERRLRDLVAAAVERTLEVSGVGRPLSALLLLTGVAKIDAPGAVRLTPLVAVADRRALNGPIFAILRMLNKRSLIARAVGLVGPSPASRQKTVYREEFWLELTPRFGDFLIVDLDVQVSLEDL